MHQKEDLVQDNYFLFQLKFSSRNCFLKSNKVEVSLVLKLLSFFCGFCITLISYNLSTIKFTHLKCKGEWILVILLSCIIILMLSLGFWQLQCLPRLLATVRLLSSFLSNFIYKFTHLDQIYIPSIHFSIPLTLL